MPANQTHSTIHERVYPAEAAPDVERVWRWITWNCPHVIVEVYGQTKPPPAITQHRTDQADWELLFDCDFVIGQKLRTVEQLSNLLRSLRRTQPESQRQLDAIESACFSSNPKLRELARRCLDKVLPLAAQDSEFAQEEIDRVAGSLVLSKELDAGNSRDNPLVRHLFFLTTSSEATNKSPGFLTGTADSGLLIRLNEESISPRPTIRQAEQQLEELLASIRAERELRRQKLQAILAAFSGANLGSFEANRAMVARVNEIRKSLQMGFRVADDPEERRVSLKCNKPAASKTGNFHAETTTKDRVAIYVGTTMPELRIFDPALD